MAEWGSCCVQLFKTAAPPKELPRHTHTHTPWLNCNFTNADSVTRWKGGTSCRCLSGVQDHRNHEISEVFTAWRHVSKDRAASICRAVCATNGGGEASETLVFCVPVHLLRTGHTALLVTSIVTSSKKIYYANVSGNPRRANTHTHTTHTHTLMHFAAWNQVLLTTTAWNKLTKYF